MEDNKKIFIRGSEEYGDKAIEYLRELSNGGVFSAWNGLSDNCIYFIDYNNNICCLRQEDGMAKIVMDNYKEVTIDEVLTYFATKEGKFEYNEKHTVAGFYITSEDAFIVHTSGLRALRRNKNVFATQKQAKSALAMAQISQYMANDKRYGGMVTDEEWNCNDIAKYVMTRIGDALGLYMRYNEYAFLAFHTPEQRELFLYEHSVLVKDYLMID